MLPSPTAWLGRRASHAIGQAERWHDPARSNELSDFVAALALLPTPCARDWKGQGYEGQLPTELALLPTPVANDDNKSPEAHMAMKRRMKGGERKRITSLSVLARNGFRQPDEDVRLLPTPRARVDKEHGADGKHWGELRPVVESLSNGASTNPPSDAGKRSPGLLLNPSFVEWMLGAPDGWSDPDCPLSATEFKSRSATSWAGTSSSSSGPA